MATKVQFSYAPLEPKLASKLDNMFGVPKSLIEVNPGKVLMTPKFADLAERIRDMEVRPDDVWLASLPRTGSTWTQEMVWLLANNLDYEGAKVIQHIRAPILEFSAILSTTGPSKILDKLGDSVEMIKNIKQSPRFVKTHLPRQFLPEQLDTVKPKTVYVARNPKDMCVSYYHYLRLIHDMSGTSFDDFCELFLSNHTPFGVVCDHILGFWKLRNEPNIMFVKYEDMKRDQIGLIRKAADFLNKSVTDDQIQQLADYLSFNSMKKNPAVNLEQFLVHAEKEDLMKEKGIDFIRKGVVGDHKNYMSPEMEQRFDRMVEENLAPYGLTFD